MNIPRNKNADPIEIKAQPTDEDGPRRKVVNLNEKMIGPRARREALRAEYDARRLSSIQTEGAKPADVIVCLPDWEEALEY